MTFESFLCIIVKSSCFSIFFTFIYSKLLPKKLPVPFTLLALFISDFWNIVFTLNLIKVPAIVQFSAGVAVMLAVAILVFGGSLINRLATCVAVYVIYITANITCELILSYILPDSIVNSLNRTVDKNYIDIIINIVFLIFAYSFDLTVFILSSRLIFKKKKFDFTVKTPIITLLLGQMILTIFSISNIFTPNNVHSYAVDSMDIISLAFIISITILNVILDVIVYKSLSSIEEQEKNRYELIKANETAEYNLSQYEMFDKLYRKERIFNHDIKSKLIWITESARKGDTDEIIRTAENMGVIIDRNSAIRYCENELINVVLQYKINFAKALDINCSVEADIDTVNITNTDLCSILSNLMDNAIDGALTCTDNRFIIIKMFYRKKYFAVQVINSAQSETNTMKNNDKRHGFGTKILNDICNKYNGYYSAKYSDGKFTSSVIVSNENQK